jgi:hypothetical protein
MGLFLEEKERGRQEVLAWVPVGALVLIPSTTEGSWGAIGLCLLRLYDHENVKVQNAKVVQVLGVVRSKEVLVSVSAQSTKARSTLFELVV